MSSVENFRDEVTAAYFARRETAAQERIAELERLLAKAIYREEMASWDLDEARSEIKLWKSAYTDLVKEVSGE